MALLSDFVDWLWAVLNQWQVLVTGGMITAMFAVVQAYREKSFSWSVNKRILLGFLVLALFLAWREQRRRADHLEAEVARERDSNATKLVGRIEQTIVGEARELPNLAICHINVTIINEGAPSLVHHWKVSVSIAGKVYDSSLDTIPNNTLIDIKTSEPLRLMASDAIYEKTLNPIPRGGLARGWLRVSISGLSRMAIAKAMKGEGAKWSVSFEDYKGTVYSTSFTSVGEGIPKPLYYPDGSASGPKR